MERNVSTKIMFTAQPNRNYRKKKLLFELSQTIVLGSDIV